MTLKNSLPRALLLGALTLCAAPRPAAAQAMGSTLTAACVGGAIGCSQADFFLTLDGPGASTALDFLRLTLTGPGWLFSDPNLSEAEVATGLTLVDPMVSDLGLTFMAGFPFGAMVDPWLRVRTEFDEHGADLSGLRLDYVGGAGGAVLVRGSLSPASVTPEPVSLVLLATGLLGVGLVGRRSRRASRG
jgi:hypothetical protein